MHEVRNWETLSFDVSNLPFVMGIKCTRSNSHKCLQAIQSLVAHADLLVLGTGFRATPELNTAYECMLVPSCEWTLRIQRHRLPRSYGHYSRAPVHGMVVALCYGVWLVSRTGRARKMQVSMLWFVWSETGTLKTFGSQVALPLDQI